ncbi:hypothetical protein BGZ51_009130 [Haplosporangium sp. Z 767]|nr:hypothetical protein BGZ51_009130 [Haplosporangium sp. Z 767]KAF9192890.1 hypothetical protein BGZ50_008131 [Haplosporangium sp. Z 11]
MIKSVLTSAAIAVAVLLAGSTTEALPATTSSGQTGALISANEYCIFLPPKWGGNIAESEDSAVAFCNKPIHTAPDARILPKGLIKSVHFVENKEKGYVQLTGRFDRTKYGLSADDEGGQYDPRAPYGSHCAGYSSFVQITEPDEQIYCIRCCKNKHYCPTNKSTDGCKDIIDGDYS